MNEIAFFVISFTFLHKHIEYPDTFYQNVQEWADIIYKNINLQKWAATCDFQQCGILTSVDSDEPIQPACKLRNSEWCSVNGLKVIEYSSN